jgi:hypothetical protein
MGLDSLLSKIKADVSAVSAVQASNDAACGRYGTETAGVSGVSVKAAIVLADTSDTVPKRQAYQAIPLLPLACTPDTSDTAQNTNAEVNARYFGWLIHFTDREPLTVAFSPEVNHADALACYPDAVAAEPMPEPSNDPTPDDRITCRQCSGLSYSGVCSIAAPGAAVSANRGYRPDRDLLQRCEGYRVKP